MNSLNELGQRSKVASKKLALCSEEQKNKALRAICDGLINNSEKIIEANKIDLENGKNAGLKPSILDRLELNEKRISDMAKGVMDLVALPDPIGLVLDEVVRPNGIKLRKISVPMGVIGIIYEARPNVTSDAAAICLKAGSSVILRGGKEAINSNKAIVSVMREALKNIGLPEDLIILVTDTSRKSATDLMTLDKYLDLLIPRGGAGLIRAAVENSTVPVIETGTGNCHAFIDESADLDTALNIVVNGKVQRPSVCNALESLLVHEKIADKALPLICEKLHDLGVKILGCKKTCELVPFALKATDEDYFTEFLDLIISIKVVNDIDEAIKHIDTHSTKHSEVIITKNSQNAIRFQKEIDAAAVYVNASTRFTDGGEFGLGAEIGISTQKLHARGPMGLKEITSYKYIIDGNGQIR